MDRFRGLGHIEGGREKSLLARLFCIGMAATIGRAALAQLITSTSFEPAQGYVAGSLLGQNSPSWLETASPSRFSVVAGDAQMGAHHVACNTSLIGASEWAWQDLSSVNLAAINRIIFARCWLRVGTHASSDPASAVGIDAYSVLPFARMGALRMIPDSLSYSGQVQLVIGAATIDTLLPAPLYDEWVEAILIMNRANGTVAASFDGQALFIHTPFVMPEWNLATSKFADADLYAVAGGSNSVGFDDYRVDAVPLGTLMGRVDLQDWSVDIEGVEVTIEIRQSGNVVETFSDALDADGFFQVVTSLRGDYDVAVRGPHWLTRQFSSTVSVTDFGVPFLHVSLINGDVDEDNEITLVDFAEVSSRFGIDSSHANWLANADLDGDEEITLVDFGILSSNFGQAGD